VGAEAIINVLVDITKVLQGVRSDLQGLIFVVKDHWGRGGGEESLGDEEDRVNEDEECNMDVPELREEMMQYWEFVWERLGREIPGFDDEKTTEEKEEELGGPLESVDNAP
jgi:hypothetical protein